MSEDKEMSFIDHLEELRWHIIRSLIAVVLFTIVAFIFSDFIFNKVILGPIHADFWTYQTLCELGKSMGTKGFCITKFNLMLQNTEMGGQIAIHISYSITIGIIIAFPYIFWEVWKFVKPALHLREVEVTSGAVFFVTFFFMIGAAFGYYILAPFSINFLTNYVISTEIKNDISISSYVSTLVMLVLGSSLMFQMPMVVYFFAKIGIATPLFMRTYRRHSVVTILIISAVITPADVFTQLLVALPLFVLYELSIFVAAYVEKQQKKIALKEALTEKQPTSLDQMED